jgi:hypothetical protein
MKKVFVITDTPDSKHHDCYTTCSKKSHIRGAEAYNNDIKTIDGGKVQYDAGQI